MNLKNTLMELLSINAVSGSEEGAYNYLTNILRNYTTSIETKNGNIIAHFGNRTADKPHVLIDAHIDQIGMICTYIMEDGFIKFSNIGGLDLRIMLAQQVIIHGKEDVYGVISSVPPHLSSGKSNEVKEISDLYIDTGYKKEELEKIVSLGDKISFYSDASELLNDRIASKSIDNRSSVASILYMISLIGEENIDCSFSVLFSSQEEIGERGAKIAWFEIEPDFAIAVDVTFAKTADEDPYKCGNMDGGPMIGVSPSLSREISEKLINICKKQSIPYQIEVMNGLTGTNADQFSISKCGVKTCTCSIPLKYMHTPVEVVSVKDIENTSKLLVEFLKEV